MKTLISIILPFAAILFLFINSSFSQQDSLKNLDSLGTISDKSLDKTYYVEDCEFCYFDSVTFINSVSGIKSRQLSEISFDNVSKITFKKHNYLELLNNSGKSVSVNLKDAKEVNVKKGAYTGTGFLLGVPSGTFIGLIIGAVADGNSRKSVWSETNYTAAGAVTGALLGGLIGAIIGSTIHDEEVINLKDIREVDRQSELKNFLRNNSNF